MRGVWQSWLWIPLAMACGSTKADPPDPTEPVVPTSGQTWWADLESLEIVDPEAAGGLLDLVAGDYPLLLSAIDVTGSSFALVFALANAEGTQDRCSRTITMDGITLDNDGRFTFGPEDFALANGAMTEDLHMTGQFSNDLSTIHSITMKGTIRLESIPEDLLPLGGVDICDLLESIYIDCDQCRDGSNRCLPMHMEGVTGTLQDGVSLQVISEANSFEECTLDTGLTDD